MPSLPAGEDFVVDQPPLLDLRINLQKIHTDCMIMPWLGRAKSSPHQAVTTNPLTPVTTEHVPWLAYRHCPSTVAPCSYTPHRRASTGNAAVPLSEISTGGPARGRAGRTDVIL